MNLKHCLLAILIAALVCCIGMLATAVFDLDVASAHQKAPEQKPPVMQQTVPTNMPKPGPEMGKLKFLIGNWNYTETLAKSTFHPNGGTAAGIYNARLGPGGFSVIVEFSSKGAEGNENGHEVLTWDPTAQAYVGYAFGSDFPGYIISKGGWEGSELVLQSQFAQGKTSFAFKAVYKDIAANSLTIDEYLGAAGKPLELFANVKATRTLGVGESVGHPVVHFEIGCQDRARTEEFFSKLFGWKIERSGPASTIETGGSGGISGHITALGHEPHHYVTFYVQVEDLPAALEKVKSLGGKTLVPPVEIPGQGGFAWFADPDGNTIGLWKPKQ